jgi:hypothetical protein
MLIDYTPTITGGFVFHIMRDEKAETNVKAKLDRLELSEEEAHDLVKAILIAGFRDLESDVDKNVRRKINRARQA